jgi:HD-GYP domain-containing protein (c-di-GMP phosphodiesterase class II)
MDFSKNENFKIHEPRIDQKALLTNLERKGYDFQIVNLATLDKTNSYDPSQQQAGMDEITINLDEVSDHIEEKYIETIREFTNGKYVLKKNREFREVIKNALQAASKEDYVTAISNEFFYQIMAAIKTDERE